jgi:ABC-type glycerol-3-phosphate transport system permease component
VSIASRAGATSPLAARAARRPRVRAGSIARHAILLTGAVLALYPVAFILLTALKDRDTYLESQYGLPWPLFFGNFQDATRGGEFALWFWNSTILTTGSVVLCTVCAALASFAIARMRFHGRDVLLSISVALMVVPPVVMLIPLFIFFTNVGLVSTYTGVILIYAGLTMPFSVYLLTGFFRSIPDELVEAALIDGASSLRVLVGVVLPMATPALVTLIVVNSLWAWNELLIALVFLPADELKTLMVGITVFRSRYNLDVPITMAGMLLASLPMVALYLFGQRFFIRGLTAGAVKG